MRRHFTVISAQSRIRVGKHAVRGAVGETGLAIVFLLAAFAPRTARAQTFTVLYSFSGLDGSNPGAPLTLDSAGNLYGTTQFGGAFGAGTVFKLTPAGVETVLHSFSGHQDGGYPDSGLVRDAAGNFVGTAPFGGSSNWLYCSGGGGIGCGVVFSVSPSGKEAVLHAFGGTPTDGSRPLAGLVRDSDGNSYGTTYLGGAFDHGTLFKLTPTGSETMLHSFADLDGSDGENSQGPLVLSPRGYLYGTTYFGGTYGQGTVFKASTVGEEHPIYNFTAGADGCSPIAGVLLDKEGNLYGTTFSGGSCGGFGTVFQIGPSGEFTTLYSFTGSPDGAYPVGQIGRDKQGNLYGTTWFGGSAGGFSGYGVVYKLDPSGVETILHTFTGGSDGGSPFGGLVLDSAGNIYGTTSGGGVGGNGVIFKITP